MNVLYHWIPTLVSWSLVLLLALVVSKWENLQQWFVRWKRRAHP